MRSVEHDNKQMLWVSSSSEKREVENGSFGKGIRKAPNRSVKYFQALFTYLTSVDAVDQKHEYEFH